MLTAKQLKRLKKAYTKLRNIWIKSNDPNKAEMIQSFNECVSDIEFQMEMLLIEKERYEYSEAS